MTTPIRTLLLAATLALSSAPAPAGAAPDPGGERAAAAAIPRLEVGTSRAALVAGAALVLWGAAELERRVDDVPRCRWCEPSGFDRWARRNVRWRDGGAAGTASDVLLLSAALGSAAAAGGLAASEGNRRELVEDVLLVAAAFTIADAATVGIQHAAGRARPYAWAAGEASAGRDLRAFFSGHTSRAFAAAAAATEISRRRGRRGAGWVAAAGFALAAGAGWMRVASDQHWATDVLAGAAAGTAIGWAVPAFALRPSRDGAGVTVRPMPGGLAISF